MASPRRLLALAALSLSYLPSAFAACTLTVTAQAGDTCASLAGTWGISVTVFLQNNPGITSCSKLDVGASYCIDADVPVTTSKSNNSPATSAPGGGSSSPPSTGPSASPDGTCGNGVTCAGSRFGTCCSAHGWCGSTVDHCGAGCQAAFGSCEVPGSGGNGTTTSPTSPTSPGTTSPGTTSPPTPPTSKPTTPPTPPPNLPITEITQVHTTWTTITTTRTTTTTTTTTITNTAYATNTAQVTKTTTLPVTQVQTQIQTQIQTQTQYATSVSTVLSTVLSSLVTTQTLRDTHVVTRTTTTTQTKIDTSIITTITTVTLVISVTDRGRPGGPTLSFTFGRRDPAPTPVPTLEAAGVRPETCCGTEIVQCAASTAGLDVAEQQVVASMASRAALAMPGMAVCCGALYNCHGRHRLQGQAGANDQDQRAFCSCQLRPALRRDFLQRRNLDRHFRQAHSDNIFSSPLFPPLPPTVAPFWRTRLFQRGARAVRPPVPVSWKHPHALTRRIPTVPTTPPTIPPNETPSPTSSSLLHRSKASFLAGYRAARSNASLGPPPRIPLRERYIRFRLETLPRYRQRAHSRVYRFLVERAHRRALRLHKKSSEKQITARLLPLAMDDPERGSGSRRRRFAALANNVYRAGVAAASEIRDQYNTSRAMRDDPNSSSSDWEEDRPPHIPGAFPDVAFATGGDAQMVLFPMYAKRHVKKYGRGQSQRYGQQSSSQYDRRRDSSSSSSSDERMQVGRHPDAAPNWHQEFARLEDEKAVVDVNVHGWLYLANRGPLTRKNRILLGLARRLSGIPAPNQWAPVTAGPDASVASAEPGPGNRPEDLREAQKILRAAEAIERRGQGEKEVANRGGYSETPETAASYDDDSSSDDQSNKHRQKQPHYPPPPGPGKLTPKSSWSTTGGGGSAALEMTEAELTAANTNLLARLGPFLTTPVVDQPVTLFFYNETQSQSRTVTTSDAGHFSTCAALDFVPTHVRVLVSSSNGISSSSGADRDGSDRRDHRIPANISETALVNSLTEPLSAVAPIDLVEDRGVSLISDIDDTIKSSNIALGTREIFRNTFVRELADMAVDGAREWYASLHALGVQFHYCSNSPWQLFPMLTTFFKQAGLPRGPLHLKQYSGMLQGIFEPVAERKRGTLEKILRDFPNRRFLLVGDSGEADLEVYTDLVLAHPGRILAIFIRDVTTPEQPGYFTTVPVAGAGVTNMTNMAAERRPALPPRMATAPPKPEPEPQGPVMGTLIDFGDDADSGSSPANFGAGGPLPSTIPPLSTTSSSNSVNTVGTAPSSSASRKPLPPPRPSKPLALRGSMAQSSAGGPLSSSQASSPTTSAPSSRLVPPPPPPRKPVGSASNSANNSGRSTPNPNPRAVSVSASDADDIPPPPPPRRVQTDERDRPDYSRPDRPAQSQAQAPPNKKVDMWRRRLAHAQDVLGPQGVALYTWRRGQDVAVEAIGIVKQALKEEKR